MRPIRLEDGSILIAIVPKGTGTLAYVVRRDGKIVAMNVHDLPKAKLEPWHNEPPDDIFVP